VLRQYWQGPIGRPGFCVRYFVWGLGFSLPAGQGDSANQQRRLRSRWSDSYKGAHAGNEVVVLEERLTSTLRTVRSVR